MQPNTPQLPQLERIARRAGKLDIDRFRFGEIANAVHPVLAAKAAFLEAAKWRGERNDPIGVDPYGAGPEPMGDAVTAMDVLGPDRRRETKPCIVGDFDRVFLVAELDDAENGTEHLLACDPHLIMDLGENGRLHNHAAELRILPTTAGQARAVLFG